MKANIVNTEGNFKPIEIVITLQTLSEVEALLNIYNIPALIPVNDTVPVVQSITAVCELVSVIQDIIK